MSFFNFTSNGNNNDNDKGVGTSPTLTPMQRGWVLFLSGYLLVAAIFSIYAVYALWAAERPPAGPPPEAPKCAQGAVSVAAISPATVPTGFAGDVVITGCGFGGGTQVSFNGTPHSALNLGPNYEKVSLSAADVAAPAQIVITVTNAAPPAAPAYVGSASLTVAAPTVVWSLFGSKRWTINLEVQLLLMVLLTGSFGSCIYALKSLADYRGDDRLYASWVLFYWIQPFEGAGIAFLLYLAIRGGFLGTTSSDIKTANQFGLCAIAGLAGAFSDIAFLKLREVFQTLFKPQDDRSGKLGPKIGTTTLPDGTVGIAYKQTLQVSGGVAPFKWAVNPALPAGLALTADTGVIAGTPTAVTPKTKYRFTATDSSASPQAVFVEIEFEIKAAGSQTPVPPTGPKISTASLPPGNAGTAYNQTLTAAGGVAPLLWSVAPNLPAGLSFDQATGAITGTPTAASASQEFTFTVKDSATPPLSDTKKFSFTIL